MSTITPVHNQFLAPLTAISILNRTSSTSVCCFCARHGGHRGGSRWESEARSNQLRFRFEEDFLAKGGQRDADFGFGKAPKKRSWWSDDEPFGGNGFEDDDEDEDFQGFGAKEGSIGVSWIFKILRAFGWMVPPVVISSLLLGESGNTIVMALALPLAQTALSLVIDTFFSRRTSSYKRQRQKASTGTKKKKQQQPYAARDIRMRGVQNSRNGNDVRTKQDFGGWDELDR
ncbi:unnamed protein product [Cuscuta epithymum]|uniref:Uncharacterized protein n=1 Tax=Cuscuta epithymum TaxID=186058 RepID=A0AAV0DPJ6_9ASTE|nr:unnamed protein product [Cuscuta epithymum]